MIFKIVRFGYATPALKDSTMSSAKNVITRRRVGATIAFSAAIAFSLILLTWPNLHYYRQSALVDASLNGKLSRMKFLLALGADANEFECPNVRCLTPLVAAVEANQSEAVRLLLARGANVNKRLRRGQTALMFASYKGNTEMVKFLLSNGADPTADCEDNTALHWAEEKGHPEIVNLLLAAGATR